MKLDTTETVEESAWEDATQGYFDEWNELDPLSSALHKVADMSDAWDEGQTRACLEAVARRLNREVINPLFEEAVRLADGRLPEFGLRPRPESV